jgi:hypothetical protein
MQKKKALPIKPIIVPAITASKFSRTTFRISSAFSTPYQWVERRMDTARTASARFRRDGSRHCAPGASSNQTRSDDMGGRVNNAVVAIPLLRLQCGPHHATRMFAARAIIGSSECALGAALAGLLLLGACTPASDQARFTDEAGVAGDLADEYAVLECVPFARELSGVQLRGAAADWWRQAEGRYARTSTPAVGSLLVFRRSARLAHGHVAVVSRVISDREIRVTQANWVRHRVISDMPVIDVSPDNDWRLVRVWWPPSRQMGITRYPTYGFILSDNAASRDQLVADLPEAIQRAFGTP